jgi:ankyrin repeat protein
MRSRVEVVKLLLENGVNIDAANCNGHTALINAVINDDIEVVKLLLENGVNIEAVDRDGINALINAVLNDNIEAVKLLLERGADVNSVDNNNYSSFVYAAKNGDAGLVKLLLENGATIDISNDYIEDIYFNEDFDMEKFIATEELSDSNAFKENHPIIKNYILGVHWWQTVLSRGANNSLSLKPFYWNCNITELFKIILNNKIASAVDYKEVSTICKNIMLSKEDMLNSLKNYSAELYEENKVLNNRINAIEKLFKEIVEEIIIPIYGEDDNALIIPNLSLLALTKILSNTDDHLKFFKINPFAIDEAKVVMKAKLVSKDQREKLILTFAKFNLEEVGDDVMFKNIDYHNKPYNDSTNILGDDVDNSNV